MIHEKYLTRWLKGHSEAIRFVLEIHQAIELWDDLIDKDKPITHDTINAAFFGLLVSIPRNGFYQQHFSRLSPLIENAIFDWHAANEMEARKAPSDLQTAYGLKCSGLALTTMCASIIGGPEWARDVNLELRSLGESWVEYSATFGVK